MKRLSSLLTTLMLSTACAVGMIMTAGTDQAAAQGQQMEIEADITVTGIVAVMEDGVFLDDGSRLFLLIGMEDPRYEGMTIEVNGQYVIVDGMPAIKVQDMSVLEGAPQDGEPIGDPAGSSGTNG
jgi:DNA/RNA endonuclease YhcR with UshA esterase domain